MFITLWDVKDPTHLSQRVGRGVPGVLVWSLCYFMIHGMGGLDEVANGLMAAIYADVRSHPCSCKPHLNISYRKCGI